MGLGWGGQQVCGHFSIYFDGSFDNFRTTFFDRDGKLGQKARQDGLWTTRSFKSEKNRQKI